MQNTPKVSVIIPSYNGETTVRRSLSSVLAQDFDGYEVIVVDSSNDNTAKIIEREFPGVRLCRFDKKKNPAEATNIGVGKARGEYLFLTDIDCAVNKDWISEAIKLFETDGQLKGLCLAIDIYPEASVIERVDYLLEFYHWLPCQRRKSLAKYLVGCSSVYKKEVFFDKKFDESRPYGQDVALSFLLADKGYKLSFEPSLKLVHITIRKNFSHFIRRQLLLGKSSSIARGKTDKRLEILFSKFPILILTAPFCIVPMMGLTYLVREDYDNLFFFLKHFPLFLIGNIYWAIGFLKEAASRETA